MNTYNSTIEQEKLSELSGYKKSAEIAAFLAKNKVPFFRGKRGRVFTTIDAVNHALGLKGLSKPFKNPIDIEIL